jgi:hypothetical protein
MLRSASALVVATVAMVGGVVGVLGQTAAGATGGATVQVMGAPTAGFPLTGATAVTVTGTGFEALTAAAESECNTAPDQPVVTILSQHVPVGRSRWPDNHLDIATRSGNWPSSYPMGQTFDVVAGTVGPPAIGTDSCPTTGCSASGSAATDARSYPCPPTSKQSSAGVTCALVLRDATGTSGSSEICFVAEANCATTPGGLIRTLHDPGASFADTFGTVAVSGPTTAVGAPGANGGAGTVSVYTRGASGWPTSPTVTLHDPSATAGDAFGRVVAVSGGTLAIGAPGVSGSGAVYLYIEGPSGWRANPTVTLADPRSTSGDAFGTVALSGGTLVVGSYGAAAAYLYRHSLSGWPTRPTRTWHDPSGTGPNAFGSTVAISGATAVIGAPYEHDYMGASYVYTMGTSGWPATPTATLDDPDINMFDAFGSDVSVAGDTVAVGTSQAGFGGAYLYVHGASGWPSTPTVGLQDPQGGNHSFGYEVALSQAALVVTAPDAKLGQGAVYIYLRTNGSWPTAPGATLADPAGGTNDHFGTWVSASLSSPVVAVGAPSTSQPGAAYLYRS